MTSGASIFVLFLSVLGISGDISPEEEQLWTHLLNTTIDNVEPLAQTFSLSNNLEPKVSILVFLPEIEPFEFTEEYKTLLRGEEKIVIFIHGWNSFGTDQFMLRLAKNYNEVGGYLVLGVDWAEEAFKDYISASSSVKGVGYRVAELIWGLVDKDVELLSRFHVLGHSLGAHVAGFVGKWVTENTPTNITRITGLDPAAPLFETIIGRPDDLRLNKDDGNTVDVIHSDCGLFGVIGSFGDSDFYINNGGPIQPSCWNISLSNLLYPILCSHGMAVDMYIDSILNPDNFVATSCASSLELDLGDCQNNSQVLMGEEVNLSAAGSYYIRTNASNNLPDGSVN